MIQLEQKFSRNYLFFMILIEIIFSCLNQIHQTSTILQSFTLQKVVMANDRPNIRQHKTPFLTQKTPFQTPKTPFLTIRNPIKMKMHQPWMITKSNKAQELKDLSTMLCPAKKMSNSIDITMQEREGKVKNVCKSFLVTLQYLLSEQEVISEQEWQIFFHL